MGGSAAETEANLEKDGLRLRSSHKCPKEACGEEAVAAVPPVGDHAEDAPAPVWSSGVCFYPPSKTLWRIGGKWYDFEPFLKLHPGGAEVVKNARDRFEDSTYAFESHHHNYSRARKIIEKYEVPAPTAVHKPKTRETEADGVDECPLLLDDKAFYSVLRRRLTEYLRNAGYPGGGPTRACCLAFWVNFAAFVLSWVIMYAAGSFLSAVLFGFMSALLGAFGHNWVHQPQYRFWAFLSLDTIGFSSTGWYREHVLQHHMYTNTPWDNHFKGTEPFLVTDPTRHRSWVCENIWTPIVPVLLTLGLTFGLPANYSAHLGEMFLGREDWRAGKVILPLNIGAMICRWGVARGALLSYTWIGVLGIWYFTCALMNHNSEMCVNVDARNKARDWGEAQLVSSADWDVQAPFWRCWKYLWLNYHTVHHMFPKLDMSHHHAAQKIMMETCAEHDVHYQASHASTIYKEMIHSFTEPLSLCKTILIYGGTL
jgi:fatty acid desaturase/cytochrome b involved in lipid metabolism